MELGYILTYQLLSFETMQKLYISEEEYVSRYRLLSVAFEIALGAVPHC